MHQNVTLIVALLQQTCHENKVNCLLYIASISETEAWNELNEEFNQLGISGIISIFHGKNTKLEIIDYLPLLYSRVCVISVTKILKIPVPS